MSSYLFSQVESNRFNFNIYRYLSNSDFDYKNLKSNIVKTKADIVFARLNSSEKDLNRKIFELGFPVIHADTLVYYHCDLSQYSVNKLKNNLIFEEITSENSSFLDNLVKQIFVGYTNHYWSNPFLNRDLAIEGYIEWASSYKESYNRKSWFVKKDNIYIGFATCSMEESVGEGVLYGVLPEHSGGGIYTDIIRFTQQKLKEMGCTTMKVSTQIQNFAVQKVWNREGFFLKECFDTYHINSMLQFGNNNDYYEEEIYITDEDINRCIDYSGDDNPIHHDVEVIRSLGFKDKVVHGILINSIQSKIFGTKFPGYGTLFSGIQNCFIQPIFVNERYLLSNRLLYSKGQFYTIVSIITNSENEICMVTYNQLIKKSIDTF